MKMQLPVLFFMVVGKFLLVSSRNNGVIYYVKPSESTQCPGQPCETLQYYFENAESTLHKQKNITMIFLTGYHNVTSLYGTPVIGVPVIRMIGENQDGVISYYGYELGDYSIRFIMFAGMVVFKNLTLIQWDILLQSGSLNMSSSTLLNCMVINDNGHQIFVENSVSKDSHWGFIPQFPHLEVVLSNCIFYDTIIDEPVIYSNIICVKCMCFHINNCTFINTPLSIREQNTVLLSGATVFKDTKKKSAVIVEQGNITMSGNILFLNNSALIGGAMALYSTTLNIAPNTVVTFINNTAEHWGGAIYVAPGIIPKIVLNDIDQQTFKIPCYYWLLNCSVNVFPQVTYTFVFEDNSATDGGDDIYGISDILTTDYILCSDEPLVNSCVLTINGTSSNKSSISSDPLHICMCDDHGEPQCTNHSYTYMQMSIHPGEIFTLPLVVVGGNFGLTVGMVYASVLEFQPIDHQYILHPSISPNSEPIINASTCTAVNYTLYSRNNSNVVIVLTTTLLLNPISNFGKQCGYNDDACFLKSPIYMNFTILPCLPGFILLSDLPKCDCHPLITQNLSVTCHIVNETGYFSRVGDLWIDIQENEVVYGDFCPHNYCKKGNKQIQLDVNRNSSSQCDFNRAGRLCGKCDEGYSLAIGSSNCILCKTNDNLSLIIFFAAAGFLLVFFISVLNITVTQGTINGLIFYANIVWTYKDIFFPQVGSKTAVMIFLKTFIAWLNLDFGIETCFMKGLTAFWKTWLEFIFPFYMWIIAGLIIIATRHSTRLTNLLGNRAVPLLATLFLLSYMKLLRIVESSLEFSFLSCFDYAGKTTSRLVVWSVDGSLAYFEFPHILLFLAGLITLLFLWMPYTLLLFLMQWVRRLPQRGLLKWIMHFNPLYEAYFAPLKHKHHYWFGALLLTRGILLVTFASSFAIPQDISLLILLIFGILLVYYMVLNHPYKSTGILILQSSYLINLVFLSSFFFFSFRQLNAPTLQSVAIGLSTGFAFMQFCGTVIHAVIAPWCCQGQRPRPYEEENKHCNHRNHKAKGDPDNVIEQTASGYRDSILDDSDNEPFLPTY